MSRLLWAILSISILTFVILSCSDTSSIIQNECDSESELVIAFSSGIESNLSQGSINYDCDEEISYQFSLKPGYENLNVLVNGESVAAEGIILMTESNMLTAVATRIPTVNDKTKPLQESLVNVMNSSDPAKEYQKFIDLAFQLIQSNPDSASNWLKDVEKVVNEDYTQEERSRIDKELSGEMFFINTPISSNMIAHNEESSKRTTDVVFINGIWNTYEMSINSSIMLHRLTREAGLDNYINSLIYNPTTKQVGNENKLKCGIDNLYENLLSSPLLWSNYWSECTGLGDLEESLAQMINVNRPPETSTKIAEALYDRINQGNQVIVVSHSQGNLMIRDAIESNSILTNEMKKRISVISLASPGLASTQTSALADFDCWIVERDIILRLPGSGCDSDNNLIDTDYSRWFENLGGERNMVGSGGLGIIHETEIQPVAIHSTKNYFGDHPDEFTGRKQEKELLIQTLIKHQESLNNTFEGAKAVVTTTDVTNITSTSALSGGFIESDGGLSLQGRGVCWSKSPEPNINDGPCTSDGTALGEFESQLTNLQPNTEYYVRAYAVNSKEVGYGEQFEFQTLTEGQSSFYLADNGVTIMCPTAAVGEKGVVNGIEYEAVDNALLRQRRDEGKDMSKVCTSKVQNMNAIFLGAGSFNQDIRNWDVGNVENMSLIFFEASSFNQDIGIWDVSNVTNMNAMFTKALSFNGEIGNWDVGNVTDMEVMFARASSFNQDISNWDVGNVTNMRGMFRRASSFDQDIGMWNVAKVQNMRGMFRKASSFNGTIGNWDVGNVINMRDMFWEATSFNQNISNWDVSNVTDMGRMFYKVPNFNSDIGDWNVGNVSYIAGMFASASSFNQNLSKWDVSNVTRMTNMFDRAVLFNQDLGSWDVSNVTEMRGMFYAASSFNQNIGKWDVSNVTDMIAMFAEASSFNMDISSWCVSNINSEPNIFSRNSPLIDDYKPRWGTCPGQ